MYKKSGFALSSLDFASLDPKDRRRPALQRKDFLAPPLDIKKEFFIGADSMYLEMDSLSLSREEIGEAISDVASAAGNALVTASGECFGWRHSRSRF